MLLGKKKKTHESDLISDITPITKFLEGKKKRNYQVNSHKWHARTGILTPLMKIHLIFFFDY